ncbi:hypothetical protein N9962_00860 [bacterium]|nr:hypothetical protein [bacterium]
MISSQSPFGVSPCFIFEFGISRRFMRTLFMPLVAVFALTFAIAAPAKERSEKNTGVSLSEIDLSNSVQCSGIAKSTGVQCKNKTNDSSGRCHHHR